LPAKWREDLIVRDSGETDELPPIDVDAFNRLSHELGGQLAALAPSLINYFEAGYNLLLCCLWKDGARLEGVLRLLELPKHLLVARDDLVAWANDVHAYFQSAMREQLP
jgi:hypothetical protein